MEGKSLVLTQLESRFLAASKLSIKMASWRDLQEEIREGLEETRSRKKGLNPKRHALMNAIRHHNLEKVDTLLNQGLDPNFRDSSGDFPLHVACLACADERSSVTEQIVERLVYMGAELEVQDRFSRLPLHVAACCSHRAVEILLDKGCSINAQDNAGCTALMEACHSNSMDPVETVTLLLHHNANIHLTDARGFTALHCICENSVLDVSVRNKVALLLLQAGLSATTCDYEGKMALCHELDKLPYTSYRRLTSTELQLVETLLCAGSNLLHHRKNHQYWVSYALNTVHPKILLMLLDIISPVLTRPSLRMISKTLMDLKTDGYDTKDNEMLTEVSHLLRSVDSLQCICRLSIRANLRGKLLVGVPQLPLPNKLKNFLMSISRKPV
ncbi:ankyrin repeat and SOCS box protein 6-like isoform X2 [Babylonia areolata]|uniref:ankyrin repeat and SOCS box protein 6-like isoform X2 n=1 Tax=Babylonia areolata TaxID=304850 RepID=UPI003FD13A2B